MTTEDLGLERLSQELAGRFRGLGELFSHLSQPKAAAELLDSLIDGDPKRFDSFVERLDIPMLNKCFWLREIIERLVVTPKGLVTVCWLKENLTPGQRRLYLMIALRYRQLVAVGDANTLNLKTADGHTVIPDGPFLEELKANNLVDCHTEQTYESSIVPVLGPPEQVCV
jgi:hypothetical protein